MRKIINFLLTCEKKACTARNPFIFVTKQKKVFFDRDLKELAREIHPRCIHMHAKCSTFDFDAFKFLISILYFFICEPLQVFFKLCVRKKKTTAFSKNEQK